MTNDCWNHIGVLGDHSCPELKTFIHCRNCTVYSASGRGLLDREAPAGYIDEWTDLFSKTQLSPSGGQLEAADAQTDNTRSVLIFRLGIESLALPAKLFKEITHPCVIHTIPHRSNEILEGIVNIRGEILLCISLTNLLGLEIEESKNNNSKSKVEFSPVAQQRMVVIEKDGNRWVFTADEVSNIQRFRNDEFKAAPAVITQANESYTKFVINWKGKKVNYLDDELLFYTISRRLM